HGALLVPVWCISKHILLPAAAADVTKCKAQRSADKALQKRAQHSITFTARPPREVSLYLVFMSAPVSRMVLMTLSRDTKCCPSPRSARRAALTALVEAMAFRSMQG